MNYIKKEPLVFYELVSGVLSAAVFVAAAFGVKITGEQLNAMSMLVLALLLLVIWLATGVVARKSVTANANVAEWVNPEGMVIAGEANDLRTAGAEIRAIGEVPSHGLDADGDGVWDVSRDPEA